MISSKPLFKAGDLIVCPLCYSPQVRITVDLYAGQVFAHGLFEVPDGSEFKPRFKAPTLSWCHSVAWGYNGALFLDKKGWWPYEPFSSKNAKTDEERQLEAKKIFTF